MIHTEMNMLVNWYDIVKKNAFTTFQDKVCDGADPMFLGEDNDWDE